MYLHVYTFLSAFLILASGAENSFQRIEADFIVVGAGAAGAVVANRLSENGQHKVLLLEAGEEPLRFTKIPYLAVGPFGGAMDWNYETEKQEHGSLNYRDQKIRYPRGRALGGSTVINAMIYTRGDRKDYDQWKALGNEGWGYEDVLPFFKKLEDYRAPLIQESDGVYHGTGGPMIMSNAPYSTSIADAFLEAGKMMGYSINDHNAGKLAGFSKNIFTLVNGTRWNTYDAYLEPFLHRRNLQIITNALVTKILFDNDKRANGIEYEHEGKVQKIYSKKEIIISAGAVNSPQLLMLSGIGPEETLKKFQIPVVANLRGVGLNLLDHVTTAGITYTFPSNVGINHNNAINPETMEMWETRGEGPLTVPVRCEAIAFVSSRFAPPNQTYPDIEFLIHQFPGVDTGLKLEAVESIAFSGENLGVLFVLPILLRPKSIGFITIKSASPYDHPLIQPNILSDDEDVKILIEAIKLGHEIMQQEPFKKLGGEVLHKKALGCEMHDHDEYFKCVIRHYSATFYHSSGTCKMGKANDPLAVVDNRLRVYGVRGLRIIDASITPSIVSAHTMVPTIMIGEKGAAMILEDWISKHEDL